MGAGVSVVIIADDLTGAMDAAVPFARRGLTVRVFSQFEHYDETEHRGDVLSISTNSRHLPPDQAGARITEVAALIAGLRPEILIKKIDSTLRGNVVVESIGLMQERGLAAALVCPAVPSQGRSMVDGMLYLDGIPLQDTPIGKDLRSAPPSEPLATQFQQHVPNWRVVQEKPGIATREIHGGTDPLVCVGDAASEEDLQRLLLPRRGTFAKTLFIGASGLTEAVAEKYFGPVTQAAPLPASQGGSVLFVIGSLAPETGMQHQLLLQHGDIDQFVVEVSSPVQQLPGGRTSSAGRRAIPIVLKAPAVNESSPHDPEHIVEALGAAAVDVVKNHRIDMLVATGGDTVEALLARFGIAYIEVMGEVEPGVVYGVVETAGAGRYTIVTKAGGFGKPDLFIRILEFHERGRSG